MPRVHEVAKELGISSSEALSHLERMGEPASSHASSIDEAVAQRLRDEVANGSASPSAEERTIDAPVSREPDDRADRTDAVPDEPTRLEPEIIAPAKKRSIGRQLAELPLLVLIAFVIAIVIKTFVVQAFYIPSESMQPTLQVGDRVLVEKLSYRIRDPEQGDVVVFARSVFGTPESVPWHEDARNFLRELLGLPTGREEDYIKRVVAVGGDTIRYSGTPRKLTVNGEVIEEPYIRGGRDQGSSSLTGGDCRRLDMERRDDACLVPAGQVFVMGDNRSNSEDSRSIGPIDEDKIVGHAFLVIWPPRDFGTL